MYYVSASLVKGYISYLVQQGFTEETIFEHSKITSEVFEPENDKMEIPVYKRIIETCLELSKDKLFGFHQGQTFRFSSLGALGYFMENSKKGIDVYQKMAKYQQIIGNGINNKLIFEKDSFTIKLECVMPESELEQCLLSIISKNVSGARSIISQDVSPIEVYFGNDYTEYHEEIAEFIKAPIFYNHSYWGIKFPNSILESDIVSYSPNLEDYFQIISDAILNSYSENNSYEKRIVELVVNKYASCLIGIEQIADDLCMGIRTLQRKLKDEKTSFKTILDNTRKQLTLSYMKEGHLPLSQISVVMGFSEPSAFHRTFKRWTGDTPKRYRERFRSAI